MSLGTPEPNRHIALGAYIIGAPSDPSKIDAYAKLTGAMPRIVMWYQAWESNSGVFQPKAANTVRSRGAMPLISWEPWRSRTTDPEWALSTIISGAHDPYIRQWTKAVAAWGHPIYVRLMYEMNGYWTAWSPGVNGNTTDQFVRAWRHIVNIARAQGADNIRWVWAPNINSDNPKLSSYASVFPGDDYVDWVGLDGFNWGTSRLTTSWRDVVTTFKRSVTEARTLTAKPVMIAEVGSSELGGDKAAWIADFPDRDRPARDRRDHVVQRNRSGLGRRLAGPVVDQLARRVSSGCCVQRLLGDAALRPGPARAKPRQSLPNPGAHEGRDEVDGVPVDQRVLAGRAERVQPIRIGGSGGGPRARKCALRRLRWSASRCDSRRCGRHIGASCLGSVGTARRPT